jgi:hypothetical protein
MAKSRLGRAGLPFPTIARPLFRSDESVGETTPLRKSTKPPSALASIVTSDDAPIFASISPLAAGASTTHQSASQGTLTYAILVDALYF